VAPSRRALARFASQAASPLHVRTIKRNRRGIRRQLFTHQRRSLNRNRPRRHRQLQMPAPPPRQLSFYDDRLRIGYSGPPSAKSPATKLEPTVPAAAGRLESLLSPVGNDALARPDCLRRPAAIRQRRSMASIGGELPPFSPIGWSCCTTTTAGSASCP